MFLLLTFIIRYLYFLHFIHDFGFIKKVYDIIGVVFCWASYA